MNCNANATASRCPLPAERPHMSCPVCSKRTAQDWRPFSSRRCADLDLGKWMTGAYMLPANDETEEDSLPEPPIKKPH